MCYNIQNTVFRTIVGVDGCGMHAGLELNAPHATCRHGSISWLAEAGSRSLDVTMHYTTACTTNEQSAQPMQPAYTHLVL
jgi:hypothetical protein